MTYLPYLSLYALLIQEMFLHPNYAHEIGYWLFSNASFISKTFHIPEERLKNKALIFLLTYAATSQESDLLTRHLLKSSLKIPYSAAPDKETTMQYLNDYRQNLCSKSLLRYYKKFKNLLGQTLSTYGKMLHKHYEKIFNHPGFSTIFLILEAQVQKLDVRMILEPLENILMLIQQTVENPVIAKEKACWKYYLPISNGAK